MNGDRAIPGPVPDNVLQAEEPSRALLWIHLALPAALVALVAVFAATVARSRAPTSVRPCAPRSGSRNSSAPGEPGNIGHT